MHQACVLKSLVIGMLFLFAAVVPRVTHADDVERETADIGSEEEVSSRTNEWQLEVGLGGEFFVFFDQVVGNGPVFKLSAQRIGWFNHFLIGGGPSLQYSFLIESKEPKDKVHQMTVNGDFLIGGGSFELFAVYFHLMLGAGAMHAYDAESKDKLWLPGLRAVGGVGGWYHLTPLVSLGALVDVGFPGIIDAMISVGFHV
ncbi:MAG: hypothetical protein R6V85_02940 [Polyangia bacterium]